MRYEFAKDLQEIAEDICNLLFSYLDVSKIKCFRSYGSSSKNTLARCHTIGKLMQLTVGVSAHYGIEFLSEKFDKLDKEEQIKIIIHELMHIPKSFGGGFRHHNWVHEKNVELHYETYMSKKMQNKKLQNINWFSDEGK